MFCFFGLGLVERVVGVPGFGDLCASILKMGCPSSSKRFAVFISHAGYLRDGFTLLAKFASESNSAFSGVPRISWK